MEKKIKSRQTKTMEDRILPKLFKLGKVLTISEMKETTCRKINVKSTFFRKGYR
jgi:hypothetical protein